MGSWPAIFAVRYIMKIRLVSLSFAPLLARDFYSPVAGRRKTEWFVGR